MDSLKTNKLLRVAIGLETSNNQPYSLEKSWTFSLAQNGDRRSFSYPAGKSGAIMPVRQGQENRCPLNKTDLLSGIVWAASDVSTVIELMINLWAFRQIPFSIPVSMDRQVLYPGGQIGDLFCRVASMFRFLTIL